MTSKILTLTLLTEIDLIPANSEESFQLRSQLREEGGGSVEQRLARWICNSEVPRSNPPPCIFQISNKIRVFLVLELLSFTNANCFDSGRNINSNIYDGGVLNACQLQHTPNPISILSL